MITIITIKNVIQNQKVNSNSSIMMIIKVFVMITVIEVMLYSLKIF